MHKEVTTTSSASKPGKVKNQILRYQIKNNASRREITSPTRNGAA